MTPVVLQGTVSHLTKTWPMLGCGVGLRSEHYDWIIRHRPQMDWFEAVTENFMDSRGRPLFLLEEVRKHYPVALHGVSLSIGSTDLLNREYLKRLKALVDRIAPEIVSDHLCWSGVAGRCLHDLLPLPFTAEAIRHVVRRIQQVQEFLGRTILLENVSAYITYRHSEMREWEFLREVAKRSGCGILLDLNNIYVNSVNHEFDPYEYLRNIPGEKIGQFHLSGHADMGKYLFDSHGQEVIASVWDLYRQALKQWGAVTTLIEWDENIPDFPRLSEEAGKARALYAEITSGKRRIFEGTPSDALLVSSAGGAPQTDPPLGLRLRTLQDWMKSHIQPEGEETPSLSDSDSPLNPQGGEPGLSRMKVYASGYLARMKEALEEVYEAVRHITGETLFGDLARDYAKQFPSRHYNLSRAGIHFSWFLKQAVISSKLPFLSDLARLEWSVNQAFHAPAKVSTCSRLPEGTRGLL